MTKIDYKKERTHLYNPSSKKVELVDVPTLNFAMIDGIGDPGTSKDYRDAVESLFAISYAIKFMIKKGDSQIDYGVLPLEGLWWADDMNSFADEKREAWKWTSMIMQPDIVSEELFNQAINQTKKKKNLIALTKMRFMPFHEGLSAQIMHLGPYSSEKQTVDKIHIFIKDQGYEFNGKHHEIYLSDPRRSTPEKMKTILRQPIKKMR
jgi:hypothetical protein